MWDQEGCILWDMRMACSWQWLENGSEKILSVVFQEEVTADSWGKLFSASLPEFNGGELKVLCDVQTNDTVVTHEGFMQLVALVRNYGVDKAVIGIRVDDTFYGDKIAMYKMYAEKLDFGFDMKHFGVVNVAKQWLAKH